MVTKVATKPTPTRLFSGNFLKFADPAKSTNGKTMMTWDKTGSYTVFQKETELNVKMHQIKYSISQCFRK